MAEVSFSGERAIDGPTLWPQEGIWSAIRRDRPDDGHMNARFALPVEASTRMATIVSAISRVMSVHEGLRTMFPATGAERLGLQRVLSSGDLDLPAIEVDRSNIESFVENWGQRSFDVAHEWPVRFAVAVSGRSPVALVGAVSHLVADKFGERALVSDLRSLISGHDMWTGQGRITAVDRAKDEASDRMKAVSRRALTRWRNLLGPNESYMFDTATCGQGTRRSASLVSPLATAAVEEISSRLKVSSASVFLAATGVLVSSLSGRRSVVLQNVLSNRFSAAEAAFVGNLAQHWGLMLNIGARDFVDVVRDAYAESIRSYRMSRYDPNDLLALRCELQERKGLDTPQWFDSFHNDTRSARARGGVRGCRGERTLIPHPDRARFSARLYVEIREVDDCVEIFVIVNSQFVSPNNPQTLAVAIESLLTRVAAGFEGPAVAAMATALDACGRE
jgi:hypothetical protein